MSSVPTLDFEEHPQIGPRIPDDVQRMRGLWAEVMRVAVEDARGNVRADVGHPKSRPSKLRERARDGVALGARIWIASDERGVGSFLWICTLLDLDPAAVRARLIDKNKKKVCHAAGAHG